MKSRIKKNKKVSTRKKYKGGMTNGSAASTSTAHTNNLAQNPKFKQAISDLKHLNDKINEEFKKLEEVYDLYRREQTPENKRIVDKAFKSYTEILTSSTMYTDEIIAQHPELAPPSPSL